MSSINFDIRTLSFVIVILSTFYSFAFFVFGRLQKEFKGFDFLVV